MTKVLRDEKAVSDFGTNALIPTPEPEGINRHLTPAIALMEHDVS